MEKNFSNQEISKYSSAYSEKGFWEKIRKVAGKSGRDIVRLALTVFYEMKDPGVSISQKAVLVGALGYFIMPVDLIADAIPVLGLTDDLAVLTAAYNFIKDNVSSDVREKVDRKIGEWFGHQC